MRFRILSCVLWVSILGASQAFEGGAAWKDTQRLALAGTRSPEPALVIAGIKPGRHLQTLADSAADLCGVPRSLFHALIARESSWRPGAVSSSGARGLGQIKDSTLREVSPTLRPGVVWDGLVGSSCYLRKQFDRFGSWPRALTAYHLGPAAAVTDKARRYASDIMQGAAQ